MKHEPTDAKISPSTTTRTTQRLNVIIFAHYARFSPAPLPLFRGKAQRAYLASSDFFTFFPPPLLHCRFPRGRSALRERIPGPTSEPVPSFSFSSSSFFSFAAAVVRHGINDGNEKERERHYSPFVFCCSLRRGRWNRDTRVRAWAHSRVRVHPRYNISYSLTIGYGGDYGIESSRWAARCGV